MRFRITRHSGSSSPPEALDLLFERLGPSSDGISFSKAGAELTATWRDDDEPISRTDDERAAIGRRAVLDVVRAVCERAPDLKPGWYAVSRER